jgi:hypothetical protein
MSEPIVIALIFDALVLLICAAVWLTWKGEE